MRNGPLAAAGGVPNDVAPGLCFRYVLAMTENVESMMLDILKRIQADLSDVKVRLERVETAQRKQTRDGAALLVMMRGTVGVFDERMSSLEEDVRLIRERD